MSQLSPVERFGEYEGRMWCWLVCYPLMEDLERRSDYRCGGILRFGNWEPTAKPCSSVDCCCFAFYGTPIERFLGGCI